LKKLLLTLIPIFTFAQYSANISSITQDIKERMINGGSYRAGCPVKLKDLRYIQLTYIGFDGKDHTGELIIHKNVAKQMSDIFKKLYNAKYPIKKMRLVSDYGADDFASIEADNTSAFNCRKATSSNHWSRHAYGKAIDINPIENPYVSKNGHTSHTKSYKFLRRNHSISKAVILRNDYITKLFKAYGFRWGGDWNCCKDYQHFDKK